MSISVTPEVAALEQLLRAIPSQHRGTSVLGFIEGNWPSPAPNKLLDFMQTVSALQQLASELPNTKMRTIALKTADALAMCFTTDTLAGDMNALLSKKGPDLHLAATNLELFHELQVDRDALVASRAEIERAMNDLLGKFAKSELSDASKSVLSAQMQLLQTTIERFEAGEVNAFRASAYSIIGRVVFEIRKDKKLEPEGARDLIDDVLRFADVIDLGGKLLTLAAPLLQLPKP